MPNDENSNIEEELKSRVNHDSNKDTSNNPSQTDVETRNESITLDSKPDSINSEEPIPESDHYLPGSEDDPSTHHEISTSDSQFTETESASPDEELSDENPHPHEEIPSISWIERFWSMTCHLCTLAGYIIPLSNIVFPLVLWMTYRKEMKWLDHQAKQAINFQLSITLYYIISIILVFVLIGILFILGIALFNLIFVLIAAYKAYKLKDFSYPLSIKFIK